MNSEEEVNDLRRELPDNEILNQLRLFAELIFEAWKEQRLNRLDNTNEADSKKLLKSM